MPSPIAAVSLVAAIVQFVKFGDKVVVRLNDFHAGGDAAPKTFADIKTWLPLLLNTLKRTKEEAEGGVYGENTQEVLLPVIEGCVLQVEVLHGILTKIFPTSDDSPWKRHRKALLSLGQDRKIQQITANLRKYIEILTYHQSAGNSKADLVKPKHNGHYVVPARRVSEFVGREALLSEIERRFNEGASPASRTVILRGMGGQGKTQLALEYCRRAFDSNRFSSVFWADANTENTLRKDFEGISEVLKHPHKVFLDSHARVSFVKAMLTDWPHPWLIVFDNYDQLGVFQNILDFVPIGGNGNVLFTSRHADSGRLGSAIDITGMQEDEALELLLKRTEYKKDDGNTEEGKVIVHRLGLHPLAIDQASAYIRKRRLPFHHFIDHYNRRKKLILEETPSFWEYRRKLSEAEGETSLSVFTTWELSFQQIGHQSEDGSRKSQMLTLFSFLHYGSISEDLFRVYHKSETQENTLEWMELFTGDGGNWDSFMFGDVLAELRDLSLVQDFARESDCFCHFSLHPLISDWVKLRASGQIRQKCILRAIMIIKEFLEAHYDGQLHFDLSLQTKQELLLHMGACERNIEELLNSEHGFRLGEGQLDSAGEWFANLYRSVGQYRKAQDLYERGIKDRERRLGLHHPSLLSGIAQLALVYQSQGNYEAAEDMSRRALEGNEKLLGERDPNTLNGIHNLASVLECQGKYGAAEMMNRRALERMEEVLGKMHPYTLTSVHNLAWVLLSQGEYEAAERMNRRALKGREEVLGSEHPDTLSSAHNLACVLLDQDQCESAEQMCRRALEGREEILGKEHPDTLSSLSYLAWVLLFQDKSEAAETIGRQALEGREKALGREHPDTLNTVNDLAVTLDKQNKFEEAEEMHRRALKGFEKVLGKEHPSTLTSIYNLTRVLGGQGKHEVAEHMSRQVLKRREGLLGNVHPRTLGTIHILALALHGQKKYKEAEDMYRRGLKGREKVLGTGHRDTLTSLHSLAEILNDQGNYEAAEEMHREALKEREKVLGREHLDTLTSVYELAMTLENQEKYKAAEEMYRRALEGREKVLGIEHSNTRATIQALSITLFHQGKFEAAMEVLQRVPLTS
ncbi:MAG: hypothetical protein M1813_000488 [Trichoglossum hirsutum]|nr:MAG: hypothetical protein M1813_000488 [Trichoglossum hirsutum]